MEGCETAAAPPDFAVEGKIPRATDPTMASDVNETDSLDVKSSSIMEPIPKVSNADDKQTQSTTKVKGADCFAMPTAPIHSISSHSPQAKLASVSKSKAKTNEINVSQTKEETSVDNDQVTPQATTSQTQSQQDSSKIGRLNSKPVKKHTSTPPTPLEYLEPEWAGIPEDNLDYSFEVLKNGKIIDNIPLENKSFFVFGRLPSCDITLEHPSLSRYHAVLQYSGPSSPSTKEQGWYIFDLDSTHGTWINKRKVFPKKYYRIKVGYVIKFGGSSRLHILQVSMLESSTCKLNLVLLYNGLTNYLHVFV